MANHCKLCNVIIDSSNNIVYCNCGKGFHKKCSFKLPNSYNVFNWLCTCCETSQISKTPDVQLPLMCLLNQSLPLTVLSYLLKV